MATITIASPCPKSNKLTRRAALRGTAAIGAAVLPAGVAVAATGSVDPAETPIAKLFVLWQEQLASVSEIVDRWKVGNATGEACGEGWGHFYAIGQQIAEAPPLCASDCLIKIHLIEYGWRDREPAGYDDEVIFAAVRSTAAYLEQQAGGVA